MRLRPLIADLYCRAGGAGMGYYLAGFDVVGVDIEPQPRYPFAFVQSDAMDFIRWNSSEFNAFHASPVCKEYTKAGLVWRAAGRAYPDQVEQTRSLLKETGKPFVIENVPGSPLINPVILTGAMFGMRILRDRLFESNFPIPQLDIPPAPRPVKMGRPVREGEVIQPVGHFSNVPYARQEMGICWMGQGDLSQAIPPAYTKYVGEYLLRHLRTL